MSRKPHCQAAGPSVYRREGDVSILVAANWGNETQIVEIPEGYTRILLNNYADLKREAPGQLRLAPWQSIVLCRQSMNCVNFPQRRS